MALPTAEVIRGRVLGQISGTALDAVLEDMIEAADATLAAFCMFPEVSPGVRTLESSAYTLYFNGPSKADSYTLPLRIRPVTDMTSVACDPAGDWTYSEVWTENTDYILDGTHGKLLRHPNGRYAWDSGLRAIKVECLAGFDVGANETLVQAIALQISYWFQYNTMPVGTQQYTTGSQSATVDQPKSIPSIVKEILSPYVLWERQEAGWR